MKKIVITGASGLVATELIHQYLLTGEYSLVLISTHPELLSERYAQYPFVQCMSLEEFGDGRFDGAEIDFVLHTAFARSGKGEDFVSSLAYLGTLLITLKTMAVGTFVNISSQSVYGDASEPLWREDAPLGPTYMYALAKCASEMQVKAAFENTKVRWTNIRLASICQNARFVKVFVQNALDGKAIQVQGGGQVCSFIDISDAVEALHLLMQQGYITLAPAYNLGTGEQITIGEIALICQEIGKGMGLTVEVTITPSDASQNIGMDPTLFQKTFDWAPKLMMRQMVEKMFELK